ncbi:MAG: hypothetical protein EOP10_10245 [Proteobacteria bacterium]|nr:MAG: hypothetical protein EOP10_10245 [Pseudomonadota bacterium]
MFRYLVVLCLLQSCASPVTRVGASAAQPGIAVAETPTPPQTPEPQIEPPTVEHTAVVVGNGREDPIQSIWLRSSSDNDLIKSAVEFVIEHDKTHSIATRVMGDYRYACFTNNPDLQNSYIKDLFRRFARADEKAGTQFLQGRGACDLNGLPRDDEFTAYSLSEFNHARASDPNYVCHGTHWLLVSEDFDIENQITARAKYLTNAPFEYLAYDLNELTLSMNPVFGPKFTFSGAEITFDFQPYLKRGTGVAGQLQDKDVTEELSCRLYF